ncbi:MAG: tRNA (N(6)-L-threonylcarbamoyladenosine(37)-C(2))-methylthiotransferase MtaB [Actinomycetota bacterium]|nr:tRNA (N(6)-L-threonylcarbamoyladenosine(37)-C(2))-methylthiotransferase MtaB [Actinomycetota bacterium]
MRESLRFAAATLGCKVNQYETDRIAKKLLNAGISEVSFSSLADLYIINTCKVTGETEAKSRKIIRRASRINPKALVVVTGCYSPADEGCLLAEVGADLFIENSNKDSLAEVALAHPKIRGLLSDSEKGVKGTKPRTRALLKVQDGCDQHCSYCVIPFTRGAPKSRDQKSIILEAQELAQSGAREIVLTGVNLGSFGRNRPEEDCLESLIENVCKIDKIERIRLSSIELSDISDRLISLMGEGSKLCRHLHIPLQSGSDNVLRAMNRNYTADQFLERILTLKARIEDIAITTDIMVGFPGETEADFERTLALAEAVSFAKVHVFKFSSREGTEAAAITARVDSPTKNERSRRLIELAGKMMGSFLARFIERRMKVLVETFNGEDGSVIGSTDNYLKVAATGNQKMVGNIIEMRILARSCDKLSAEVL